MGTASRQPRSVVAVGNNLAQFLGECTLTARITNRAGIDNDERGAPIMLCRGPRRPWSQEWPLLSHRD